MPIDAAMARRQHGSHISGSSYETGLLLVVMGAGTASASPGGPGPAVGVGMVAVEQYCRGQVGYLLAGQRDHVGVCGRFGLFGGKTARHARASIASTVQRAGRRSEALNAEQQAVQIRRRLTAHNPAAHESDLARSLSNLGARLERSQNRPTPGTEPGEVAEAVFRRWLTRFLPERYGVTSGFVISPGLSSKRPLRHYDVIIYDRANSPVLWRSEQPDRRTRPRSEPP